MDKHDAEIKRLMRIDWKLNKELVQKPYAYINELKENLSAEIGAIGKTIKVNNQKYLTKIGQMDLHINDVLADGRKIINDYSTKFEGIKRDKNMITQLYASVENIIGKFSDTLSNQVE